MKLTLAEPRYLKDSVSIISDLVAEARFKITADSIELVAMDPANVAMVIFKLLSSCFTEYDVKEDTEISINLGNLKQILRRAGINDMLTLELNSNKLKVTLRGATTRTFGLPLIEIEEKEQKIPDLKFPVVITTISSVLSSAVEDADIVAESVRFTVDSQIFSITAEGDLNDARIDIKSDDNTKITAEGKVTSKYSIEYLKKMTQASKLAEEVSIKFDNDYPLKLEYTSLNKLQLAFILAPRVEND